MRKNRTKEEVDALIASSCEKLKKNGIVEFDSLKALAREIGIDKGSFTQERKETIREYGIVWTERRLRSSKEIDALISSRCEELKRNGNVEFDSLVLLAREIGISHASMTQDRKETIRGHGIVWKDKRSSKEMDALITSSCEKLKKNGNVEFDSLKALAREIGIGYSLITKERKETIRGHGIVWDLNEIINSNEFENAAKLIAEYVYENSITLTGVIQFLAHIKRLKKEDFTYQNVLDFKPPWRSVKQWRYRFSDEILKKLYEDKKLRDDFFDKSKYVGLLRTYLKAKKDISMDKKIKKRALLLF